MSEAAGVLGSEPDHDAHTRSPEEGPRTARLKVVTFAYACEPNTGSEPGVGWGLVHTAMDFADQVVLVGPEHVPGLRRWQAEHPEKGVRFVRVDEPRWARFAKWHRIPFFLVYLAWARRACRVARRLHAEERFDAAWHVTFSVYWLPSPAVDLGIPSVLGPVGGAVTAPLRLWPLLGWRGILGEVLDLVAVRAMARLPATRRTWRKATVRLANNEDTLRRLPSSLRRQTTVLNHCFFVDLPRRSSERGEPWLLFPSVLEPRKGPRLAILALAHADDSVRLKVVHEGPEEKDLRRLAVKLGVDHKVEFRGRIPRSELFEMLTVTAGALYTGVREDGGVALTEALSFGTPVVVLAHGGARTVAGAAPDESRVALVTPSSVAATARAMGEAMSRFCAQPPVGRGPNLNVAAARALLQDAFSEAIGARPELRGEARAR